MPVEAQLRWAVCCFWSQWPFGANTVHVSQLFAAIGSGKHCLFFINEQWGFSAVAWLQEFRNSRKCFWGEIMSFNDKLAYDDDDLLWGCTFFTCSGCVSFGEGGLVGTGIQKNPVRKPEPLKLFWLGGSTCAEFITRHVNYLSLLPDLLAGVYGILLT